MAPYKILKQGYMMKEPPVSKRGIRKVSAIKPFLSLCLHVAINTLTTCEF